MPYEQYMDIMFMPVGAVGARVGEVFLCEESQDATTTTELFHAITDHWCFALLAHPCLDTPNASFLH